MSENVSASQLRLFIERIETLIEEKKGILADIKDVFAEAKATGFDTATMKQIIKLRAMDDNARREREALLDLYKAALGMLDGTPLGHWAVQRTAPPKPAPPSPDPGEPPLPMETGEEEEPQAENADQAAEQPAPATIEDARAMGREAAISGQPVTANPFVARDPRRAAWDEAWCQAIGSDGMDIPAFLRPSAKKKPGGESANGGDEGEEA